MENEDALVVATSGSTGAPKGVVHTHSALRAASAITSAALHDNEQVHWLACLPLSHIGGFGVVSRAIHSETALTILPAFNVEAVLQAASDGCTHVALVVTALQRINPLLFQRVLLGGSAMPSPLPSNAVATYGLTESCGGVVYNGFPLTGVEVDISSDGEVLLRTPTAMRTYRSTLATSSSCLDSDGWLHTGDLGTLGDNGRLTIHGRRGDLIISGGENIWPESVESVLLEHPGVADVGVAGVDDHEWGQRVVAWIVPAANASVSLQELRDYVATSMPRFCSPREIFIVETLPRTALGKLQRHLLSNSSTNHIE
jgi:O-succinylbenzoic acid--CoA ligase